MKPGSLRSSVILLSTTGIGACKVSAGCLSLPQVLDFAGLYLGLMLIQVTGLVSLMSMNTVSKASERLRKPDFVEVVETLLGWAAAKSVAGLYVLFSLGTIIFYECMCYLDVAGCILASEFPGIEIYSDEILIAYNAFIWVHLSMWNSCSPAKYISCLSFLGLAYLATVLCVQFPAHWPLHDPVVGWKWEGLGIATAVSLCTVAFVTPTNVATLQNDLANPIRRRIKKVNLLVIAIQQVLYSVLGLVGYLSTLNSTPTLITDRIPAETQFPDTWMDIGKCVMFLALVCDVPTYILPSRKALLQLFNVQETQQTEMASGALCLALPTLVMLMPLDPNFLMNVLAAQCAWFFYLVPGIVELKLSSQAWFSPKNLFWLCTMLGYTGVSMWALVGSL